MVHSASTSLLLAVSGVTQNLHVEGARTMGLLFAAAIALGMLIVAAFEGPSLRLRTALYWLWPVTAALASTIGMLIFGKILTAEVAASFAVGSTVGGGLGFLVFVSVRWSNHYWRHHVMGNVRVSCPKTTMGGRA